MSNAEVLCRELNCGTAITFKKGAFFGRGNNSIWLDNVWCSGSESSILNCQHNRLGDHDCNHGEDVGVICSGTILYLFFYLTTWYCAVSAEWHTWHLWSKILKYFSTSFADSVKLVNGSNRCRGRVELYHNNQWRRVCDSGWGKEEADLACRLAGCGSSVDQSEVLDFGEAHGLSGVKANCSGNEESLFECSLQEFQESCVDATVVCSNAKPIRLVSGNNRCSGRVEMYDMGEWGTVCDDGWGFEDATVACRQMNCGNALSAKSGAFFGSGGGRILIDEIDCIGNETSLSDCRHRGLSIHDCSHSEDAGVICTGNVSDRDASGDRLAQTYEVLKGLQWRLIKPRKLVLPIPTGVPVFLNYLQPPVCMKVVLAQTVVPYRCEHYLNSIVLQKVVCYYKNGKEEKAINNRRETDHHNT
uniref:Soluble scavenger receptor cysteine-rich domain-containing protein SSC5D n=1 Tax=Sphaeramia orbicularis TaxID=375764 RepID=A0A673B6Z9_9TELE